MKNINIKDILYRLCIVDDVIKNEKKLKPSEFNSMMIDSLGIIDNSIKDEKDFFNRLINIINARIERNDNGINDKLNRCIEFRIGDLIKTSSTTARIKLKFCLKNNNIEIYKNDIFFKSIQLLKK